MFNENLQKKVSAFFLEKNLISR